MELSKYAPDPETDFFKESLGGTHPAETKKKPRRKPS
jgi:hypothetical protein